MKFSTRALFELCKSGETAAFDFYSYAKTRIKNSKWLTNPSTENDVLNIIENLGLLFTNLYMCKSKRHALFIIFMYLKTHYSSSVLKKCIEFLVETDLFSFKEVKDAKQEIDSKPAPFFDTSDELPQWESEFCFSAQSEALPDWLRILKKSQIAWEAVRQSPMFEKVSKLISMFAALGLCELSNFNVDFNGVRVFSIGAYRKHVSAPDIGAAILDTIVFFAEGAYKFFQSGSINHFLYTDQDAEDFDEAYYKIYEMSNFIRCGNISKYGDGSMTENGYDRLLSNTIDRGTIIMRGLKGPERTLFGTKYERLRKIRADFIQYRTSGKLRIAPFSMYLHGDSSVGKSYLSALLVRLVLKMNGYEATDDLLMNLNASDKFMSNAKAFVNGILLDDVGNTNPQFVQEAFTQRLIDLVNNVPYYANMAEIEQKGKMALEPLVVLLNSNIKLDKLAAIYSNNIMSIIRRCHIHITVHVKEAYRKHGFQLNSEKVKEDFSDDPYPDVWEFETFYADNSDRPEGELKSLLNHRIDLEQLIALLSVKSREHYANQKHIIEISRDLADKIHLCQSCHLPTAHCKCEPPVLECVPHADDDVENVENMPYSVLDEQFGIPTEDDAKVAFDWIKNHSFLNVIFNFLDNLNFLAWCQKVVYVLQFRGIWDGENTIRILGHLSTLFSIVSFFFGYFTYIFGLVSAFHFYTIRFYIKYRNTLEKASKYKNIVNDVFAIVRNRRAAHFFASFVALAVAYKVVQRYYSFWKEQGNLLSPSDAEVQLRDAEANPWIGAYVQKVPQSANIQCDSSQLVNVVESNLTYARFPKHPDGVGTCNMLFVKSNLAIVPQHIWYDEQIPFEVYHANRMDYSINESVAHKRGHGVLSKQSAYFVPNTDLCVVRVAGCGTWKDISKFLPDAPISKANASLIYRTSEGNIVKYSTYMSPQASIKVGSITYSGHVYTLPEKTFNGLCIATLVADTKPSVIAGVHLAGNGHKGASGAVIKQYIFDAVDHLNKNISTFVPHSEGDFLDTQCGVEVLTSDKVHPRSCVNYIPTDGVLCVYGSCRGRSTNRSDVVNTPISNDVVRICGQENLWGPPKFHPWKPFYVNLQNVTNPSFDMPGTALEWACRDYILPFRSIVERPIWQKELRVLNDIEAVSGIDGKRFIDAMVSKTAVGYPLTGPKSQYMVALNPNEYPGVSCPMEFIDIIKDEYARLEACYLRSERGYPIFKASLKDEPTKKTKDKVRVFYGAPSSLQFLVRKYFLPVLRLMSMNPIDSECAVGINAFGPEWDQLAKHMKTFGEDRIFAGDYKSYDTRMPAQVTLAAYNVLITICEMSGNFSTNDIRIMRGIATDCCYPFVAFNGDLVSFNGVHISGINVTAYVGSVANSLLKRSGYFTLCNSNHEVLMPYRDVVADMNYGDDFKGSVSESADFFNFISYQAFLAERGITLTMPDKESAATKYMNDEDADFLKRKNVYNSELNQIMGALDKQSIYKSLHCVCKSKHVTTKEQSQMNIDGALREMFLHGEADYETLRSQLKEIAKLNDIMGCLMLDVSYSEYMEEYKRKYYDAPEPDHEVQDLHFEAQSGLEGKNYFKSRYIRKRETRFTYNENSGFLHEYEDDSVKIIRRHKSSNSLEGFEPLPSFFNIPKNLRTRNQIDLLYKMAHKPCLYQSVIWGPKQRPLGDIDLGFYLGGNNEFAIFECKKTYHKGTSSKTRRQVEAQVAVLAYYNPKAIFHGFLIRGDKCEHIASSRPPTKKVLKLELFKSSYSGKLIGKDAVCELFKKLHLE